MSDRMGSIRKFPRRSTVLRSRTLQSGELWLRWERGRLRHHNTLSSFGNPTTRVPYLGFSPTFVVESSSGSYKFNSLQATVRKTFSHGLTLQGAYTWSRAFLNAFVGNPDASFTDNVPVVQEYGLNPSYHPQRFVFNYTWMLPFRHYDGLKGGLINGWAVSGVTTIQDGTPLTVTDSRGGSVFGSPVASNAQLSGSGNIVKPGSIQSKINSYFNAPAFTTVQPANSTTIPGCTCAGTLNGDSGLGIGSDPIKATGIFRSPRPRRWRPA